MRDRLRLSNNSIMIRPGRPDVLERILKEIKRLDWSLLWTINMERMPEVDEYVERVRSTWRPIEREGQTHISVPLPTEGDVADGFDRGARKNLQRNVRKLEREGVEIELAEIQTEAIDRAVDLYARQHIERWASKGGSYFRNPQNVNFLRMATKEAYAREQGFAAELLVNGEVAAQLFSYVEGDHAFGDRIGISVRHLHISPGWLILYRAMGEMRSRGVRRFHVGNGTEHYKHVMGGQETQLSGIGAARGAVALLSRLPMLSVAKMSGPKEGAGRSAAVEE
jgi:CelD/BcsL family acetyltransferase involved in cellulose biosynthesis